MEIREMVRLKKGVGGLEPPNNLAILLDRTREGGEAMARVFTLRGMLTVKWGSIAEGTGATYHGPKDDHPAMSRFLKDATARERAQETLQIDPQQILDTRTPKDLWSTLWARIEERPDTGRTVETAMPWGLHVCSFTPEDIAEAHFRPKVPGAKHVQAVAKLLSTADGPYAPYFVRAPTVKGSLYVPYTKEAMSAAASDASALQLLRSRLIREEDAEPDDGTIGRPVKVRRLLHSDLSNLPLGKGDMDLLQRICAWGVHYLENARWPIEASALKRTGLRTAQPFSLGGTQVRSLDRFDLERFAGHLFMDLARSDRDDLPSNILKVLLDMRLLTWQEASETVIDHKLASGARRFHREFSQHVTAASARLQGDISPRDREGRADLTGLLTYTIDPSDAKDFDDAVSLESLDGGDTVVWVHIADVSHYVRPGGLVDSEARFRATSVYLPTGVLPMLPPILSEELCSLKAGTDRLALSTRMVLGPDLEVKAYEHRSSIINVKDNLDYDQVEGLISEGVEPFGTLDRLARGLSEKHRRLSLETPERRVRFTGPDSMDVAIKRPNRATKLIEELMVLCNECAARTIGDAGLPTPYRVHPLPDRQSVERFNGSCAALSLDVAISVDWIDGSKKGGNDGGTDDGELLLKALLSGGKVSFGALSTGGGELEGDGEQAETTALDGPDMDRIGKAVDALNDALDLIKRQADLSTIDLLNMRLLRVLPRAVYSDRNTGHFGLRSERYCHFTSPIRRYADVLAHRTVKWVLARNGRGPPVPWEAPSDEEVASMIENLNDMSSSAEEWEREMVNVALATRTSMTPSLQGVARSARLVSLIPSTAFFLLDDGVTEGRIPLSQLSPFRLSLDPTESILLMDPLDNMGRSAYTERAMRMAGEGGGPIEFMRLGGRIRCLVRSVGLAEGRVDLSLSGRTADQA